MLDLVGHHWCVWHTCWCASGPTWFPDPFLPCMSQSGPLLFLAWILVKCKLQRDSGQKALNPYDGCTPSSGNEGILCSSYQAKKVKLIEVRARRSPCPVLKILMPTQFSHYMPTNSVCGIYSIKSLHHIDKISTVKQFQCGCSSCAIPCPCFE